MNRPALATAVLLGAALVTAGCGSTQASSTSAATATSSSAASAPSAAGTQSYASMLDLYSAVLGTGTTCSDVTIQPSTSAKAQAGCDLGSGRSLVLQTWRDSASRDAGVQVTATTLAAHHGPYCVLDGVGDKGLWSVGASGDSKVCTVISHRLGGRVTTSSQQG
jgi:hypothetical protein